MIMGPILVFDDMLSLAWGMLEFVVDYIFILCMCIFIGVMAWTIVEKSKALIKAGAPGWMKLLKRT